VLDEDQQAMLDQIVTVNEESGGALIYGSLDEGEAGSVRLLVREGYVMALPLGTLRPESYVVPTPLGRGSTS
jgi:hypothetical protein